MLKIGLTGGIGSGKSAVSDLFSHLGVPVIDTDIISRNLMQHDRTVFKDIVDTFGNDVIDANGAIDRKKLAQLVFGNMDSKQHLENILHPRIRNCVNQEISKYQSSDKPPAYVIVVIPLLFETDFNRLIDQTLVVLAEKRLRIERIKKRDNRSISEIQSIINSQVDDEKRINAADKIIENNSDFKQLELQVAQLHNNYREMASNIKENS